jgi:NAD(P)-dependent dehydrogenase (short-subunit alcohol dehydrogenase family)
VTLNVVSQAEIMLQHLATLQRVVFVTSGAASLANPALVGSLNATCSSTSRVYDLECYGRTKAMEALLVRVWAKQYPHVTFCGVHPGAINSDILAPVQFLSGESFAESLYFPRFLAWFALRVVKPVSICVQQLMWESVDVGADRVKFGALDASIESGSIFYGQLPMDSMVPIYVKNITTATILWNQVLEAIKE